METQEIRKLGIVFLLILGIAVFMDITEQKMLTEGRLLRDDVGGDEKEVTLVLDAEDILEEYSYKLSVEPQKVTKEQSTEYFVQSIEMIEAAFSGSWKEVPIEDSYVDGIVEAEWRFSPIGYLSSDGTQMEQEIPEEGILINASVIMTCGEYQQIYTFPFRLYPKVLSKEEEIERAIETWFEQQQEIEGNPYLELPTEAAGVSLEWSEKREFLSIKIMVLEVMALGVIIFSRKKKKEQEITARKREAELEYSEIVGQLLVLMEAGMTTRQAWGRIGAQYCMKKEKHLVKENYVYEAVLHMIRRFQEGENECSVYQCFAEEVGALSYRRLMRILLNNLEKGSKDICNHLKEEAHMAYEQRIFLAKKMGEETSTKMLLPLMLMMMLVMGIVMVPAIIGFSL